MGLPPGINPGFYSNAGKAVADVRSRDIVIAKLETIARELPEAAARGVRDLTDSESFRRYLRAPVGNFPAMVVPDVVREAIGAKGRIAVYSGTTIRKNKRRHPEVTPARYGELGPLD